MNQYFKKLYDWVLHWADTPYGVPALFLLAFVESSFFPIPPDILLMALALSRQKKSFYFAAVATIGSVSGGMLGYLIGLKLMEAIGYPILEFYGFMDQFDSIADIYRRYSGWAVGIAGFTPIPYKVFTIAAGACTISFSIFVIASIVGRAGRFFLVAGIFYFFGARVRTIIETYFNILSIVFVVLLIAGFILIKFLIGQ